MAAEVFIFFLWIATATLMLRPKGGCKDRVPEGGRDVCPEAGKSVKNWTDQPVITWDIAIAFTFVQMCVPFHLS